MGNINHNNIEKEKIGKNNNLFKHNKEKNLFKCIFHFSILQNDCINSLDIIDDKIIIGTIMGDVSLLRVDKNNLIVNNKLKTNKINHNNNQNQENNTSKNIQDNNINNLSLDSKNINNNVNIENNNKIACIKLKIKDDKFFLDNTNVNPCDITDEKNININNYKSIKKYKDRNHENESQFEKTNDKTKEKTRNKLIKVIKLNNESNDKNIHILKSNRAKMKKIKIKKIMIKQMRDEEKNNDINLRYGNTNIENNSNNINKSDFSEEEEKEDNYIYDNSNENLLNKDFKKFPQVTKLIIKSNENIPCVEFDTDDKINISIGDFEVLCMENMSEFNIDDKNSSYNYLKIKNYKEESQHIKHCEHCTCMMNSSNYLIIYTQFGEFNSILKFSSFKYKNRNLKTYKTVSGRIDMSNYSVPFDFDGDRFLFLDYSSKDTRKICIYYTLTEKDMYEYTISQDYGHISHMKIIYSEENKIFLCRNQNQCEIHLIDDNFTCVESWEHIGNDAISSYVYIKESKLTEEFKTKINKKKNNKIDIELPEYDNYIIENNNKSIKLKKNKPNNKNRKNIKIDILQGASTLLNINNNTLLSSSNNKMNLNYLNVGYNHTENIGKSPKKNNFKSQFNNWDNSSKREFKNSERNQNKSKIEGVEIYTKKNLIKNFLDKDPKNNNLIHIEDKNDGQNYTKSNNNTIFENENSNINNYYIITLDKNGNVNLYKEHKVKKIFNLYEIQNIDDNYKRTEFFSVGFPYYIIMNELYIGITTDHGLFVISNSQGE